LDKSINGREISTWDKEIIFGSNKRFRVKKENTQALANLPKQIQI
jgi:hypothetical protein